MTGTNQRGLRERQKHKKRVRIMKIFTLFAVCIGVVLLISKAAAYYGRANISITAKSASILQGEEIPELAAQVDVEGNKKLVLNAEEDYTVADLIQELQSGNGYTVVTNADPDVEGDYVTKAVLNEEIKEKLAEQWQDTDDIKVINGKFGVKNPVGEWDGNKFQRYDGSYIESDFVVSMGSTYYLDANGEKVSGWQTIQNSLYLFNELGVMQTNCWMNEEDDRYYLGEDGKAVTGWQNIDDATYYFHQDGKMVTGDYYVGMALCSFAEDGHLTAKKKSDIDPKKPMVALTFDDGPGKRTSELLDVLDENNAHATFFMLGTNIPRYEDTVKKMKEIGCELGNHSYDHANLSKLDADGVKEQIKSTNKALKDCAGTGATVMRPPYGAISQTVKENVDMPMILWNIDTLDWKTRDAEKTIENVMENVKDGDIILLHDIHTETIDAAIKLIPMLQEEGYQLVTVSELAGAKGIKMEKGAKYTDF